MCHCFSSRINADLGCRAPKWRPGLSTSELGTQELRMYWSRPHTNAAHSPHHIRVQIHNPTSRACTGMLPTSLPNTCPDTGDGTPIIPCIDVHRHHTPLHTDIWAERWSCGSSLCWGKASAPAAFRVRLSHLAHWSSLPHSTTQPVMQGQSWSGTERGP